MQSLKDLTKLPNNNRVGEIHFNLLISSDFLIDVDDDVILLQNSFPDLFDKIGLLDGIYDTETEFLVPGSNINLIYTSINNSKTILKGK